MMRSFVIACDPVRCSPALFGAWPRAPRTPILRATLRLVCWTSAGAPLDVMMRQVGKQLGEIFDQTFVVENRPGGDGAVAMATVKNKPADGYNDPVDDLEHVVCDGDVGSSVQARRFHGPAGAAGRAFGGRGTRRQPVQDHEGASSDFFASIPDKLRSAGSRRQASTSSCSTACNRRELQVDLGALHRRAGRRRSALLGGHIDVAVMTPSSALAQIKNGDIRLLGISSAGSQRIFSRTCRPSRSRAIDVVASIWRGVMVKAGTPQPIVDKLNAALETMKKTEDWQKFSRLNMQSVGQCLADADAGAGAPGSPRRCRIPQGDGASQMTRLPHFRACCGGFCGVAALTLSLFARAEPAAWEPQHNVEFVVPTEAGSTMDVLARVDPENLAADACGECDR